MDSRSPEDLNGVYHATKTLVTNKWIRKARYKYVTVVHVASHG